MTKTDDFDPDQLVDVTELAELCDISPRRMRQVLEEHDVRRPQHGKAPLRASIDAYCLTVNPELHRKLKLEAAELRIRQLEVENATLRRAAAKG